jgi:hypothetical protein
MKKRITESVRLREIAIFGMVIFGFANANAAGPTNYSSRVTFDNPVNLAGQIGMYDEKHPTATVGILGVPFASGDRTGGKYDSASWMSFYNASTEIISRKAFSIAGTLVQPEGGVSYSYNNGLSVSIWIKPQKVHLGTIVSKGRVCSQGAGPSHYFAR